MTLVTVSGITTVTMTLAPMQQMLAASKRERFHRVGAVVWIENAARGEIRTGDGTSSLELGLANASYLRCQRTTRFIRESNVASCASFSGARSNARPRKMALFSGLFSGLFSSSSADSAMGLSHTF